MCQFVKVKCDKAETIFPKCPNCGDVDNIERFNSLWVCRDCKVEGNNVLAWRYKNSCHVNSKRWDDLGFDFSTGRLSKDAQTILEESLRDKYEFLGEVDQ